MITAGNNFSIESFVQNIKTCFNSICSRSGSLLGAMATHRYPTVENADLIYVLKDGMIIESGSHEELLKLDGEYTKSSKLMGIIS